MIFFLGSVRSCSVFSSIDDGMHNTHLHNTHLNNFSSSSISFLFLTIQYQYFFGEHLAVIQFHCLSRYLIPFPCVSTPVDLGFLQLSIESSLKYSVKTKYPTNIQL